MHKHSFVKSDKEGYEVCTECGTYHSTALKPPDEIYMDYWGDGTGRSTLEQQIDNMTCTDECGISKVDRVLQFLPKRIKTVLEISCAPGIMMDRLLERNLDVYGIEPNINYIDFICRTAPEAKVACGYFPEVSKEWFDGAFDCIIALDVVEHISNYDAVYAEIKRLLRPNGTAIIMSPIIYEDGLIRTTEFLPHEHAWLFSKSFLKEYLEQMFSEVKFSRWITSHEIVILKK